MSLNARLPLLPTNARKVSDSLAILHDDERIVFFNAAGPIFSCRAEDRTGLRLGAVTMLEQGLVRLTVLAKALGMHRSTLYRHARSFEENGVEGLVEGLRGPKGPRTLTPDVQRRAQVLLDRGQSIRSTAAAVGMSDFGLRYAIKRGVLIRRTSKPVQSAATGPDATDSAVELTSPRERAAVDQTCPLGVATTRELDRNLACAGKLDEAKPQFEAMEAVPGAGVLLALPALLHEGLLEIGTEVYGRLSDGFFGLRSILLTFALMALLRIKTPEQLTEHAPGELGILLGLDRFPEVKTLRRKLRELGKRQGAARFTQRLTERWAKAEPKEMALLYVDGHVRPYHGRKYRLPKLHVQQRGRPLPGTKDFHVNDRRADPLLFVTAEATEGLLATLDSVLLPEIRRQVGPRRRVTIAFDREGWSPKMFAKWKDERFDVLTYRKGEQSQWRKRFFETVAGRVGGEKVEYCLAERQVKLSNGLKVREIRRLTEDGHQTAVITTNEKLPLLAVAHRMFSRWRQENFFRYMRHEFALDHLCAHAVEPADPKRLVSNPERVKLVKKLKTVRAARTRLVERRLDLARGKTIRVNKRQVGKAELDQLINQRKTEAERLAASVAKLPKQVPLEDILESDEIVQLERERKVLVDAIKLTAYRAESSLARLVEPLFKRHEDEARKLLRSIFQATADVIPDPDARRLTVRFHGLANPRATRALSELCALVNVDAPLYPGTDLRLHFEAPTLQE